jgi:methylated-DNA-protein-cysteine methyltransferase-like protein
MVGWALRNMSYMDSDVPAHRVVNRAGELSGRHHFPEPGYMQEMLELEGVSVEDNKVVDFKTLFWHPAQDLL